VVTIDPQVYDRYIGEYELSPGTGVKVIRNGNRLLAETEGKQVELFPVAPATFIIKDRDSEITFVASNGPATELVITFNDTLLRFRRVTPRQ
jgi:hypothetical protein